MDPSHPPLQHEWLRGLVLIRALVLQVPRSGRQSRADSLVLGDAGVVQ